MKPKYTVDFHKEDHTYYFEGARVPCISDLLNYFGLNDFSGVRADVLAASMHFGKCVHRACELNDNGMLNRATLDKGIDPYLAGWLKFKKSRYTDQN